ncbi:MAG: hypothetical protein ACRDVM_04160, partial [Acidimicrobiia bacterium]
EREFAQVVAPTALAVFGFPSVAFGLFPVLLRAEMTGFDVFVTGVVAITTTVAIFLAQPAVSRLGAHRASPTAFALGTLGYGLGTFSFLSGVWAALPGCGAAGCRVWTWAHRRAALRRPAHRPQHPRRLLRSCLGPV